MNSPGGATVGHDTKHQALAAALATTHHAF